MSPVDRVWCLSPSCPQGGSAATSTAISTGFLYSRRHKPITATSLTTGRRQLALTWEGKASNSCSCDTSGDQHRLPVLPQEEDREMSDLQPGGTSLVQLPVSTWGEDSLLSPVREMLQIPAPAILGGDQTIPLPAHGEDQHLPGREEQIQEEAQ